jgi:hypothetical protein
MNRISKTEAAPMLGLSPRALVDAARLGRIPGAARIGRDWTFDPTKLKGLVERKESEACESPRAVAIGVVPSFGERRLSVASATDGLYGRTISSLRSSGTRPKKAA